VAGLPITKAIIAFESNEKQQRLIFHSLLVDGKGDKHKRVRSADQTTPHEIN
jgi:hypothetical protein